MEIQTITSIRPLAACLLPVAGAVLIFFLSRISERARNYGLAAVCTLTAALAISLVPRSLDGAVFETRVMRMTPQIWIYLKTDALGVLFGVTASLLWLMAMVYSFGYMADEHHSNRYYLFFMLCLAWTMGLAYAGNLLTFLIFYELFSILTYPLVIHEETPQAMAAGTKYIIYILIGGSLVLLAIMLTYFTAGPRSFVRGGYLSSEIGLTNLKVIFWCFIFGCGVKAAIVPLHGWVPDAHPAAPAPFSALLSGIMVAAGSFGILRVIYNVFGVVLLRELGMAVILKYAASFTILFGAVLAISQDNLKRRLAYSTISQMGYVILGASLMGTLSTTGAMVHITNHAFMKGTLFFCAGVFIKRMGVHRVSEMAGIARRFPLTMAAFTITSLGMIGTPPLSGFVGKWYLGLGIIEMGEPWLLIILLGGALLAAVYLLPIVYTAYFRREKPEDQVPEAVPAGEPEAPWSMLVPVILSTIVTIFIGAAASMPGMPLTLARLAAGFFVR